MNKIIVEVSVGELLDKISILEIKKEKIKDPEKLKFISNEHSILKDQLEKNVKSDDKLNKLFQDLKEQINVLGEINPEDSGIERILSSIACHNSVRAGKKLNIEEMNSLLRLMEKTPNSSQCNHGRPTFVELRLKDVEALFGRT